MGAGGRPQKFETVEELQTAIDKYFNSCKTFAKDREGNILLDAENNPVKIDIKPITITGLALAIGLKSRQALLNYQGREEFNDTIIRAKFMCEDYAVTRLFDKDGVQGAKFNLTNNHNWVEKQAIESTNLNTNININEDDSTRLIANATPEELELIAAGEMSPKQQQEIINRK